MGFTRRQQNIYIEKSRKRDTRWREQTRTNQKKYHQTHKDKENEYCRKHYQENIAYHRQANRAHYRVNKDKWRKRRAENSTEWSNNRCTPSFTENTFASLGASLTVDGIITFSQLCALIEALGYDLNDITYLPFIRRRKYFNKKRTP